MRGVVARLALWTAAALASPAPAWACTLCHSRTAEQVRAAVLGPDFWVNVGALLSPVPVLLAAVLAARRCAP